HAQLLLAVEDARAVAAHRLDEHRHVARLDLESLALAAVGEEHVDVLEARADLVKVTVERLLARVERDERRVAHHPRVDADLARAEVAAGAPRRGGRVRERAERARGAGIEVRDLTAAGLDEDVRARRRIARVDEPRK